MTQRTTKLEKLYTLYRIVVIFVSVASIIACITTQKTNGYELLPLIPAIYLLFFTLFNKIHTYSKSNIGLFMVNILAFIKYSFATLIIALKQDFYTPGYFSIEVSPYSNATAIFLIILEMVSCFMTITLLSDHFYSNKEDKKEIRPFEKIKTTPFLIGCVVIFILILLLNLEQLLPSGIILYGQDYLGDKTSTGSIGLIISIAKLTLSCLMINHFIVKYQKTNKAAYVVFSYAIILIYCFLNTSTARRNMILPLILFAIITFDIFKAKGIILLSASVIAISFSLFAITAYKSDWQYGNDRDYATIAVDALGGIQAYTSNVRPTAIGVEAIEKFKNNITFTTFINDFAGSLPLLSERINQQDRINYYYNYYLLNGRNTSQIIPMTIIGMAYLGIWFSWLPTTICIVLLMYFERQANRRRYTNYFEKYLSLYLFFAFTSALDSNTQMIFARIALNYLPPLLILKINQVAYRRK